MKTQEKLTVAVFALALLYILYPYLPTLIETCVQGQHFDGYCSGNQAIQQSCGSLGIVANTAQDCTNDQVCRQGTCLAKSCSSSTKTCATGYSVLNRQCVNGNYEDNVELCPMSQICEGGICKLSANGTSGILSSWEALQAEVQANTELQSYLYCGGVFDCDNPLIKSMAQDIMTKYSVKTPRDYMDATATEVYDFISYRLSGGDSQCGEKSSELIQKKITNNVVYGNCVDYSALQTSLLRAQGIPARQSGGCLTGEFSCIPFAISPPLLERYGSMNSDQVLAHSYTQVYLGSSVGWAISDATLGTTIAKCSGYLTLSPGSSNSGIETCYLPIGSYSQCTWNPNAN